MEHPAELHSGKYYIQGIRDELPPEVFRRVPWRLLWLPLHLAVIAAAWCAVIGLNLHWSLKLLSSLVIGHSYACLSFLGHELLHDSIIRRGPLQSFLGWICFLHYWIGPEQWRRWHNRAHHFKASHPGLDPDSFGNLAVYRRSPVHRAIEPLGPGSRCLRSIPYFFYFFSFQSLAVLFWVGVVAAVGLEHFVFIYLVPLGRSQRDSDVVHRDEPLPQPRDSRHERPAGQQPHGHRRPTGSALPPELQLPRRAPHPAVDEPALCPAGARPAGEQVPRPLPRDAALQGHRLAVSNTTDSLGRDAPGQSTLGGSLSHHRARSAAAFCRAPARPRASAAARRIG